MPDPQDSIRLRNGSTEQRGLVAVVMLSLNKLFETDPLALADLACLCRDPAGSWLMAMNAQKLESLNLVNRTGDKHEVHSSIRNVVLAAVEMDGDKVRVQSPLEPPESIFD